MKIVAGLGTIDDYEDFVSAGADELFIGYVPYVWQKNNEISTPLNRREVLYSNVSIGSQSELEILAEKVKKVGVPVSIAINGLNYTPGQYPVIADILSECIDNGFNDVIIADLGLLIYLKQQGLSEKLHIHVSGELGEMNAYGISMLKRLNAGRIIYHRGISFKDMAEMIAHNHDIEHEAFFLNENCHFTGAYCNSLHCDELIPICRFPYKVSGLEACESYEEEIDGCRLCYLKKYERIGITHLKIVGRGACTDDMIESISLAKRVIEAGKNAENENDFAHMVQQQYVGKRCRKKCEARTGL